MERKIRVKKNALCSAGAKYIKIFEETGEIASPVDIEKLPNGQLIAKVDDEKIGIVMDLDSSELPHVYTAKVESADSKTNEFVVTITASDDAEEVLEYDDEEKEASVNSGIPEDDVKDMVRIMTESRVHPSVIKAALKRFRKYDRPVHMPSAIYRDVRSENEMSILNNAVMAALNGNALIFAGEKSTGKNVCAETLAYVLGRPYYRISFQKDMLLEDIFGSQTTDNSAADALKSELAKSKVICDMMPDKASAAEINAAAEFEYLKAKASCIRLKHTVTDIVDWAKNGGVMMMDEVNMANSNILQAVMNSAADSEKVLIVPGVGEIKLNPDCVLLGGMNPGYAGTFELNEATLSRCGMINFEYPDDITEQLRANYGSAVPEKYYQACNNLYKDYKEAVTSGRITSTCLNIRGFVNALKSVVMFPEATDLKAQISTYIIDTCAEDERMVLNQMLQDKVIM